MAAIITTRNTTGPRALTFAGALILGLLNGSANSHAAGFVVAAVAPDAPSHNNAIYLGYPSLMPVIHHPWRITPGWAPFAIRVYRIAHPHIITVTTAPNRSDSIAMLSGRREERIAFATTAASPGQNNAVAVARGAKTSFVLFP
jgi:hypothetical protein